MALLFGMQEPTPKQAAEGWEADPDKDNRNAPCNTFWWIGQHFKHCDNCGRPCWEHAYRPGMGEYTGLRRVQTLAEARAMWKKWGEPEGIEFNLPYKVDE